MKISSSLSLHFDCHNDAQIFYQTFSPELKDVPMKRSELEVKFDENEKSTILCEITADDAIGYRATINSVIQTVHIVEEMINLAKST